MAQADKVFSTSIATLYDDLMGPIFFAPYAEDLGQRVAALKPGRVLEVASGSGISTEALVKALPLADVTAVDLNAAMVEVARAKPALGRVKFHVGDATKLPFPDHSFDLVASQFGVMFFPDKVVAHAEMRRVLAPKGHYVFSLWGALEYNPLPDYVLGVLGRIFHESPPSFMRRIPHGFFDVPELVHQLQAAGFAKVAVDHVSLPCHAASAQVLAAALCQGTPMRSEIEARDANGLDRVTREVEQALVAKWGKGPIESTMQALVFTAQP